LTETLLLPSIHQQASTKILQRDEPMDHSLSDHSHTPGRSQITFKH